MTRNLTSVFIRRFTDGAGTIQGLASYYYGHLQPNRALELNRCYYNTMVDANTNIKRVQENNKTTLMCRTLQSLSECEDCQKTNIRDIYTTHFTVCGKPQWCPNAASKNWYNGGADKDVAKLLCMELHREWHITRLSLENEWRSKYSHYDPIFHKVNVTDNYTSFLNFSQGHCALSGRYRRMQFPGEFYI